MYHFEDDGIVGCGDTYSRGSIWNLSRHDFVLEGINKLSV